jgi:WD40 repeat protein
MAEDGVRDAAGGPVSHVKTLALTSWARFFAIQPLMEVAMRSLKVCCVFEMRTLLAMLTVMLAGGGIVLGGATGERPEKKADGAKAVIQSGAANADISLWKEKAVLEIPGWLPGSVAYSSDGKTIVVGGTDGKVIGFDAATRNEKWKADVGGNFAVVAFTADGKSIIATFKDGVRFLDPVTGALGNSIEEKKSHPAAVGVFPNQVVLADEKQKFIGHKIIFGNSKGYFVKSWITGGAVGTIRTSTVAKQKNPVDPNAVPLAVDPAGRSVIVTGPIDSDTGKNVLWAWVAGNYEEGSPGNRLLNGHRAVVVSAAWSNDGKTVASGDSSGRIIVWDAKTMKETSRLELGARVAALALSRDGKNIAAVVVGKLAEFYRWDTAKPTNGMKPIHIDSSDFSGPIHACLSFSPDGQQLTGSAINAAWLTKSGALVGKVHVWETVKP